MLFAKRLIDSARLSDERIFGGEQRRRRFGLGFFLELDERLEVHLAMMIEAGAGRNDVAHDDVFLEAAQVIDASTCGSLGEDTGGILERGGAEETFGLERG